MVQAQAKSRIRYLVTVRLRIWQTSSRGPCRQDLRKIALVTMHAPLPSGCSTNSIHRRHRRALNPPRIEFSRLTVSQYRNAIADLGTSLWWKVEPSLERGLKADYFASRDFKQDKRMLERTDPVVSFNFGTASPEADKFANEEFSIRWKGSLIPRETGWYEFTVHTENGARLHVNDPWTPLIDAWVRSGPKTDFTGSRFLLAGRVYPLELEWFKFKEATSSISLFWKAPHGVKEIIPASNLIPENSPEVLIVESPFPPDDRSAGYERGTSVSKEWDAATTSAAIEVADKLVAALPR